MCLIPSTRKGKERKEQGNPPQRNRTKKILKFKPCKGPEIANPTTLQSETFYPKHGFSAGYQKFVSFFCISRGDEI